MDFSSRSWMQRFSIIVGVENARSNWYKGECQKDRSPSPWKDSRESVQLALVKTKRSRMEANVNGVVFDHHYLLRHLENVPSVKERNIQ